ncbi:endocuticle structural glycoprotein SgAbd-5-like [Anopheles cruzii]|uniref:endocuticle structural glycoprotein SgAbd-5-like n=1 Tax=Anopheles cruzii TaxID=68878 RepID=UPI0022EC9246|nr:endocuticle structural glycoprotein SgAbd-5-like [Anopheles cruzii]
MKLVAVFALVCLFGVCLARPADEPSIVADDKEMNVDGSYQFRYEQSDGQKREEKAELKASETNPEVQAISVSGSYEYTDADGKHYLVTYTADENGYRPTVKQL